MPHIVGPYEIVAGTDTGFREGRAMSIGDDESDDLDKPIDEQGSSHADPA